MVRLQLARMAPGTSDIKVHQDSGGYATHGHRIHVPLTTHPLVDFKVCPDGEHHAYVAAQLAAAAAQTRAGGSDLDGSSSSSNGDGRRLQQLPGKQQPESEVAKVAPRLRVSGQHHLKQQHPKQQQRQQHPVRDALSGPASAAASQSHATARVGRPYRPCVSLPLQEGLVFELNNRVPHRCGVCVLGGVYRCLEGGVFGGALTCNGGVVIPRMHASCSNTLVQTLHAAH